MNKSPKTAEARAPESAAARAVRADRNDAKIRAYLKSKDDAAKARARERIREHLDSHPGASRDEVIDAVARVGWTPVVVAAAYDDLMAALRIGRSARPAIPPVTKHG